MAFESYPPAGEAGEAKARDKNLEGNPTSLVNGILFFLEARTLLLGKNDKFTKSHSEDTQRIWDFTSPKLSLPSSPVTATPSPKVGAATATSEPPVTAAETEKKQKSSTN